MFARLENTNACQLSPQAKTNRVMSFLFSCTEYMFTLFEQVSIKPGLLVEEL